MQQDIEEFDFWGHCDCDLIFGDLAHFITDDMLSKYSKLFTLGHLTIYKNESTVNTFYKTQNEINYKKIYTNSTSFAFDEWSGVSKIWKNSGLPFYDELVMDDIWPSGRNLTPTKALTGIESPYQDHNIDLSKYYLSMKDIVYEYNRGKLYRKWKNGQQINEEEVAYVHMQKRKMSVEPYINKDNFLIVPNKFISFIPLGINNISKLSKKKKGVNDYLSISKKYLKKI